MPKATTIKPQSYDVFIYKSTGAQANNRYNSWSDLMTAITKQEGFKTIVFEQDETIPAGAWNLDYVTLKGNGAEYSAGGYTITFGDSTTISSWLTPSFSSLLLKSTSTTGHICTFTGAFTLLCESVSNVQSSATYEFFASSYTGQNVIGLRNSARWSLIGGSTTPLMKFTGVGATVILSRGDGSVVNNNTFSSSTSVTFIDIVASANQAISSYPSTHSAMTIGFTLPLNLTAAEALAFTPAGSIAATNVQDAIEELDTEKTTATYVDGKVSDTAYAASWDGVTTIAPSKNAVYDKIETLGGSGTTLGQVIAQAAGLYNY